MAECRRASPSPSQQPSRCLEQDYSDRLVLASKVVIMETANLIQIHTQIKLTVTIYPAAVALRDQAIPRREAQAWALTRLGGTAV